MAACPTAGWDGPPDDRQCHEGQTGSAVTGDAPESEPPADELVDDSAHGHLRTPTATRTRARVHVTEGSPRLDDVDTFKAAAAGRGRSAPLMSEEPVPCCGRHRKAPEVGDLVWPGREAYRPGFSMIHTDEPNGMKVDQSPQKLLTSRSPEVILVADSGD